MSKKAKAAKQNDIYVSDPLELRRWCIEQAIRWPAELSSGYGVHSVGGFKPPVEADIIARANKILSWVTSNTARG